MWTHLKSTQEIKLRSVPSNQFVFTLRTYAAGAEVRFRGVGVALGLTSPPAATAQVCGPRKLCKTVVLANIHNKRD